MQHYLDDKASATASNDTAKQNLEYFADTMGSATEDFLGFNYNNLTNTTFGGDINHTASTNAPGNGVLLNTNTQQFNQDKEQGELDNRMPPNAFGIDWSNMDVGAIQAQAMLAEIAKQADKKSKEEMMEATKTYGPVALGTACTVMSMSTCATVMAGIGIIIDSGDYVNDIPINGIDSPKAGKVVMDLATFRLSRDIIKTPFLGAKGKITGQVATGMLGFVANGWADKAAEQQLEEKSND